MKGAIYYASLILIILTMGGTQSWAQPMPVASYSFDQHDIREDNNRIPIKPVSLSLIDDRFGNKESAILLHGQPSSYLNLGTSELLKPKRGSISLWTKLYGRVYAGKGADFNPIIETKRCGEDDFYNAYLLCYEASTNSIVFSSGKDTTTQTTIIANDTIKWGQWYHCVITWDHDYQSLYINGLLQTKTQRGYDMEYLKGDSVVLGISANNKNYRCTSGTVDDIFFYDHVLTGEEVLALYNAPNPNKLMKLLTEVGKYAAIITLLALIIIVIIIRNRQVLKRQKATYELQNKISELEVKVIKSQMNPHFISNSLAAIQDLIYKGETERAGLYLAKFSFFLRKVLYSSDKNFVPLSEELEIIKLNIELEQLRLKDQFDFLLDIATDVDTEELQIPAMITQPFIENAIWHGLLPLGAIRPPKLTIRVYLTDQILHIDIQDNGVGRQTKTADKNRLSMGTQLIEDKINSLNKLMNISYLKFEIIDLLDADKNAAGTKVAIQVDTKHTQI